MGYVSSLEGISYWKDTCPSTYLPHLYPAWHQKRCFALPWTGLEPWWFPTNFFTGLGRFLKLARSDWVTVVCSPNWRYEWGLHTISIYFILLCWVIWEGPPAKKFLFPLIIFDNDAHAFWEVARWQCVWRELVIQWRRIGRLECALC